MSLYSKIHNEFLINDLKNDLNCDILLFGADGFIYFGHLQSIEDCRLAILTPAISAETCDVEIITPGGCLITVDYVRVDLCGIVGKGTGIVKDPVYHTCPCKSICHSKPHDSTASDTTESSGCGWESCGCNCGCRPTADESTTRTTSQAREYDCLVKQVKRLIGDNVALTTVGGFLFEGILSDVYNCMAFLTIDEVFIPGCSGYISNCNFRSAVVNLEAITSVSCGGSRS